MVELRFTFDSCPRQNLETGRWNLIKKNRRLRWVPTKIAHKLRYTGIKKFKPLAESRHLPTREVIDEISVVSSLVRPF